MEIWATPTHPPLRTYTNSSLASCILVQLSDLCNLGFAVHVQYSITNTCWRHAHYWGCAGVHRTSHSLIYKKSPPNCCLRAKKVWKIGNFMYFWTKKWLKLQGRVLFCQICTLWGKKKNLQNFCKMPTFRKSGRDPLLKNLHPLQTKILGMGLVEASQMHRLRKQGGLRELSPSIFWVGGWSIL